MQTRSREIFTTIHIEGSILPPDLLQRISSGDTDLEGLSSENFHLLENEKLNEAINRSWNRMLGAWKSFIHHQEELPEKDIGTSITRERWLLPLFRELGYGRLNTSKAIEIEHKSYPISHFWKNTPIHLLGYQIELDKRRSGVAGAATSSPHSMIQELLNRSEDQLWAFLSNGYKLRILRDNVSLTRQAFVEFNIEAMMEGEVYADFVLLWLLSHQSRVEAEKPAECWLEKWSKSAQEQGTRALDQLRRGVEDALTYLGKGFLAHPENQKLREDLRTGKLDKQDYYRQLLRLIYRLIFLFVAEDRNLLHNPSADIKSKDLFRKYYSTSRIRKLAEKEKGTIHSDLYQNLIIISHKLGDVDGCPELGLTALGSFLFSKISTPDLNGTLITNRDFLNSIRALSFILYGSQRQSVDYKNLGSEELGSIYESLLELHPDINLDSATFELKVAGGHERKTTGSYYTPSSLIQVLLDSALDPVVEEALKKPDPEEAILNLKVCDPACGSGHFLIAASHRLARKLAFVRTGEEEPPPEELRHALRDIIGHCIYGVDINEMAVELCKVGLWMETLEPGKPLSFLDHRILCGNSLLCTTPVLLEKGIPDDALKPIEGDDKSYCSKYRIRNKKERESGQISFLYEPEFLFNKAGLSEELITIDKLPDDSFIEVAKKNILYEEYRKSNKYILSKLTADAWCAAFVWKKTEDFEYPITHEVFRRIQQRPEAIPDWLNKEIYCLSNQYKFFHWHIEFPDVFIIPSKIEKANSEEIGWIGGFDVVLGNPPWDRVKLHEQEFFNSHGEELEKVSKKSNRLKLIKSLKEENSELYKAFLWSKNSSEATIKFIRGSGVFTYTALGELNTYMLFAEISRKIINKIGYTGLIVPTGIATDNSARKFFDHISYRQALVSLFDFENRKAIFADVHRSYKFCLLTTSNRKVSTSLLVFFLTKVEEIKEKNRQFSLSANDIKLFNPNTRTLPIFRSEKDMNLVKPIYNKWPILFNERSNDNPWNISFMRLIDATHDSNHLLSEKKENCVAFYEPKMIWHFDHRYGTYANFNLKSGSTHLPTPKVEDYNNPNLFVQPKYWVDLKIVEQRLFDKWSKKWYVGFRMITNSTNERTVVFSFLPYAAIGNSMPILLFNNTNLSLICCLVGNFNSFIFDYVARQKIGGTALNTFLLKQLPIIVPNKYSEPFLNSSELGLQNFCSIRVLELSYTSWDLKSFAVDFGYDGPPFKWDEKRRFLIRCELDAAYFHLYGIEFDDVDYVMETFPIVKRRDVQKYNDYRTKRVILEIYDKMAEAIRTGQPYQTRLDPPPADPRVAHSI